MMFFIISLLAYFNYAASGNVGKLMRQSPSITHSVVNLGKMDISFYIGKPSDRPSGKADFVNILPNIPIPRPEIAIEPCPCSEFRSSMDNVLSKPSEIINKILMSKDLFKSPLSTVCCDSHEPIHEDTFILDITPNDINKGPLKLPTLPIDRLIKPQMRSKALDIFLFPKRKDLANVEFMKQTLVKEPVKKEDIKKVGKDTSFIKPINEGSSVKKDLAVMEKNAETKKEEEKPAIQNTV